MRSTRKAAMVAAGVLAIGSAAGAAALPTAAAASAATPDTCIMVNGGDWNACNVGNVGRGGVPYPPALRPHSVALCIDRNQGERSRAASGAWTASTRRSPDQPPRPASRARIIASARSATCSFAKIDET